MVVKFLKYGKIRGVGGKVFFLKKKSKPKKKRRERAKVERLRPADWGFFKTQLDFPFSSIYFFGEGFVFGGYIWYIHSYSYIHYV